MAEHAGEHDEAAGESLLDKITEKIHSHDSSSDSDDDKASKVHSVKSNVYRLFGREKPVHKVLGGGKPADVLLWRNKKTSAGVLVVATVIWILFELIEYHLITLVCHLSILSLAIFFLWSNVATFIKKSPPQIPEVLIPNKCFLEVASALRIEINCALAVLRDIALGRDLKMFLAIITGLWILSIVGNWFNFLTLCYISLVLLHTLPVVYEKYEDQIDPLAEKALVEIKKQYAVLDKKVLSKIPIGPFKEKKND